MKVKLTLAGFLLILVFVISLSSMVMGQKHYKELTYPKMREIKIPVPEQVTLDNGIRVFILEDHELPFIKIRAQFVAGSAWEPADKVGLASITGNVMRTGGSQTMPGDQMDEELESIAASVETWIATLYGGAAMSTLKDHFDKVLTIFADVLMNPAFPDDKIDLAKIEVRSNISRRNDQVTQIAHREFHQLIYGEDSPYYRDTEYTTIDAISRQDIVNFHQKYVRPNGMVLAVWGDFKTKDMIKKIRKTFKDWKSMGSAELKPPEVHYEFNKTVNLVKKTDINQTNIYIGHLGGKKDNPDNAALVMMNEVLSGGFSSRLFSRVRSEQGLAYHVSGAYATNYIFPGVFYMVCQTKSERTIEAIRSLLKEMRLMTEELVTDEELKVAKEGWLNSFVFNFDSVDKIMKRLLTYAYYGYPLDFLQKTKAGIEAVTKEDILRVAKKHLKPDKVQILAVGKPDDFDEPLSVMGEVNKIDITIPVPKEELPEATKESLVKGKELFKKMVTACGGPTAFKAVKSYQWKGSTTMVTPQGEMAANVELIKVSPDRMRVDISMPMGQMSQIMNGDYAWIISPQGTTPAPEQVKDELKAAFSRDFVVLFGKVDQLELTVQYIGSQEINGQNCEGLLFTPEGVKSFKIYLDGETMMPVKMSYQGMSMMGAPVETEELFSDYLEVENIKLPSKIIKNQDGKKVQEIIASEVVVNVDVDDSQFVVEQ